MVIQTSLQNLIAILGFTAVALGFAFKDYISSLIAGIVAIYERPYRVGDWVTIDGAYGEVQSLSLRSLRLYTPDDTVVSIPHIKIWTTNIFNANDGNRNLLCVTHFYVDPDHDAARARQKLHDVALTSPYLDLNHRIRVIVQEQPWGTHYQLKAYPLDSRGTIPIHQRSDGAWQRCSGQNGGQARRGSAGANHARLFRLTDLICD